MQVWHGEWAPAGLPCRCSGGRARALGAELKRLRYVQAWLAMETEFCELQLALAQLQAALAERDAQVAGLEQDFNAIHAQSSVRGGRPALCASFARGSQARRLD